MAGPSPKDRLKMWTDGSSKLLKNQESVSGAERVGGFGIVYDGNILPNLYGPLKENLTEKATNNVAELQAAILGLQFAKSKGYTRVEAITDSKLLENIMTKWLDQWKERGWKKSCGSPLVISVHHVKTLDRLRHQMDITWNWQPRNSCPELSLADKLANKASELAMETEPGFIGREGEVEATLYRNKDKMSGENTDCLPPTLLRSVKTVLLNEKRFTTFKLLCSLDISPVLTEELIRKKKGIMVMTSSYAYGNITTLRTCDPLDPEIAPNLFVKCHLGYGGGEDALLLQEGCVVGVAWTHPFSKPDDQTDQSCMGGMFWTADEDGIDGVECEVPFNDENIAEDDDGEYDDDSDEEELMTEMMSGSLEGLASSYLCNKEDPTMLTRKELKAGWGTVENFMLSYGLKPYNPEDCEEAVAISRALKENN